VPIKQHKDAEDGDVSGAKNDHRVETWSPFSTISPVDPSGIRICPPPPVKILTSNVKKKFQWLDVEQHDEQQHAVEHDTGVVLETVTAKEFVLIKPD